MIAFTVLGWAFWLTGFVFLFWNAWDMKRSLNALSELGQTIHRDRIEIQRLLESGAYDVVQVRMTEQPDE